jgi:2-dehydro-3-deoxyphosphooctonate aldolase (KDO 8-P synthase)
MKKLIVIAGPCVVESYELLDITAEKLTEINKKYNTDFYFKASYRKANRTSKNTFTGIGDETALKYLADIGSKYGVKTITDIHSEYEAQMAAEYVTALQIPAFLCRQTELLQAAARTGKVVNIKKGQFLNPEAMRFAAEKVADEGNNNIMLTERGSFFGYTDLVVDFRSFEIMKQTGYPVIYDATHSVQQPAVGTQSGGLKQYIFALARSAAAANIDGIFFEAHPNPDSALSDKATQLDLSQAENFLEMFINIRQVAQKYQ